MEYIEKILTPRAATALAAAETEYTAAVDCLHANQVSFFLSGTLAYPIPSLACTTATDTSLVDQADTGNFSAGMVGMTVAGTGIDSGTTVSSVTNAKNIILNKATLASAADVLDIAFAHTSIGLASVTAQVRRDPGSSNWLDKADAACVQQSGGTGTSGLTDGSSVVVVMPKNALFIPWSQMRLKLVGHASKLTPALRVVATVAFSGATPSSGGSSRSDVVI